MANDSLAELKQLVDELQETTKKMANLCGLEIRPNEGIIDKNIKIKKEEFFSALLKIFYDIKKAQEIFNNIPKWSINQNIGYLILKVKRHIYHLFENICFTNQLDVCRITICVNQNIRILSIAINNEEVSPKTVN